MRDDPPEVTPPDGRKWCPAKNSESFLPTISAPLTSARSPSGTKKESYVWIAYGALITMVLLLVCGIIGRYMMKISYNTLIGVLSGASTNPPALANSNEQDRNIDEAAIGYATVYPLTMFLRVLNAQMMILFL